MATRMIRFYTTELRDTEDNLLPDQAAAFKSLQRMKLSGRLVSDGTDRKYGAQIYKISDKASIVEGRLFRIKTGDYPTVASTVEEIEDAVLEVEDGKGLCTSAHFAWYDLSKQKMIGDGTSVAEGLLVAEWAMEAPKLGRLEDYVEFILPKFKFIVRPIVRSEFMETLESHDFEVRGVNIRVMQQNLPEGGFGGVFVPSHSKGFDHVDISYRARRKSRINIRGDINRLLGMAAKMSGDRERLTLDVDSSTQLDLLGEAALKYRSADVEMLRGSKSVDPKQMLQELHNVYERNRDEIVRSLGHEPGAAEG